MGGIIVLWNHIQLEHAIIIGCHRYFDNYMYICVCLKFRQRARNKVCKRLSRILSMQI